MYLIGRIVSNLFFVIVPVAFYVRIVESIMSAVCIYIDRVSSTSGYERDIFAYLIQQGRDSEAMCCPVII